jgi:asparagine N-glycosylation enzyme membrane subunit Stt3
MEEIQKEVREVAKEIEERKKGFVNFLKKKGSWIYYAILAVIISISVYIRTLNLPKLKDITTGTWTLGPDLDPFLFLRWAKYIVEHGKLFLIDTMRSVPLADICSGSTCDPVNTATEMKLLPYMIAWLSKFLNIFDKESTVTYAAVIFPVIMAVLTAIVFFLFARKLFYKENKNIANVIALIATAFFVLVPSLLPRTIAGIPEKESSAFFFLFAAFYFFLEAFTSENTKKGVIYSILAGIMTGLLGLTWGGITFAFLAIAGAMLFAFIFGKIDKKRFLFYSLWLVASISLMIPFSTRYPLESLVTSSSTGLSFVILFVLIIDFLIFKKRIIKLPEKITKKLPPQIISIIIAALLGVLSLSAIFGVTFVADTFKDVISHAVEPFTQSRFGVTVAENKQPYFTSDWASEFGPVVFNIPLYFWLFFIGAIFLFNSMIKFLTKKEKIILDMGYTIFLLCLIFSKYSSSSLLNGESGLSLFVYFLGVLMLVFSCGYVYLKRYKSGEISVFEEINFPYLFYSIILTMMIIASRGAIRLIMVLGAVSPIAIAFLIVKIPQRWKQEKEDTSKLFIGIIAIVILIASIFTIWSYYQTDAAMAQNYAPSMYTQQWQKAMAWVRENTPVNAVFAHWWDYGYWLQSLGERATILDGGNAVGYWNHFMGRNVLTGTDESSALDFLYAHNGTHLLIDSTDIGKYGAFSSIGSDANYDRYSWIPTIFLDQTQTQEKNNKTISVYPIGTPLDEDITLQIDGKDVLLPRQKATVAAIALTQGKDKELLQPIIYFVYNEKQYQMPLRYIYFKGEAHDFKNGLDAGIFIFPNLIVDDKGVNIQEMGAALYLSERTVHSGLARLYLNNEKSSYFKLVHTETSPIIEEIRRQGLDLGEFVYYQGFQGPIKIWEISYPTGISLKKEYLNMDYPEELTNVNAGEY